MEIVLKATTVLKEDLEQLSNRVQPENSLSLMESQSQQDVLIVPQAITASEDLQSLHLVLEAISVLLELPYLLSVLTENIKPQ